MLGRSGEPTQLEFLEGLVDAHASVAGDVLQIGMCTWAIHGSIPVDGEVLVARYESAEEAIAVLTQLGPNYVAAMALHAPAGAAPASDPGGSGSRAS